MVNIKAWISLRGGRTWLKRQGRQRAADEIVSSSFLVILVLLVVMGMQAVSDGSGSLSSESIIHIEVAIWCMLSTYVVSLARCGVSRASLTGISITFLSTCSVFMLRFMMLGSNINKKYQNTSLLLTEQVCVYAVFTLCRFAGSSGTELTRVAALEQMNVYLRLLAKPHKKEKLLVSNNVLKLACKLLKVRPVCLSEMCSRRNGGIR